jgi:hypothetical protein
MRSARSPPTASTGCSTGRQIIRLDKLDWHGALHAVEAEDLWPPRLWKEFVGEFGDEVLTALE